MKMPKVTARMESFTIENPPNGGVRAWLVVVSCSAINALIGVLEPTVGFALFMSEENVGMDEDTLSEIYEVYRSLSSVYAPLAIVSMITLGYELSIHIGSWCLAVSFLVLSFITNVHGIKFLLYVTAGIGSSLVELGVLIPVLEYFTTKRMRALMFTRLSRYSGQLIPLVIYLTGKKPTWQTLYRICMSLCIPIGLIGLTIPSLTLTQTKNGRTPFIERILGLVHMKVLKNIHFWLVCFLFFVYQIGTEPPNVQLTDTEMPEKIDAKTRPENILYGIASVIGLIAGAFTGWLFKFSVERKFFGCMKQTPTTTEIFYLTLMFMVGLPFLLALMCFIAPEAANFPYFFIFSIFFFTQLAFIEELRDDMIPDVFGRYNVKFAEGLIHMFAGMGGIIASESAAALHWKDSFRMGGGVFLATAAVAVCILLLQSDKLANVMKIKPLNTKETGELHKSAESTSNTSESEASEVYVTSASGGQLPEAARMQNVNSRQSDSFSTSNGPSNIRFVIPRKNRMYGSRDGSISSYESVESDSSNSIYGQYRSNANGHTVYTDLQASKSPDSYGIIQTNGQLPNEPNTENGKIANPSQYILYSYNIAQTEDEF